MEGHYGNAMTEIALALAMAFFSVMVLTMVSMGAGSGDAQQAAKGESESLLRRTSKESRRGQLLASSHVFPGGPSPSRGSQ